MSSPLTRNNPPRHIAWFLTAHGFGHGVRTSALLHSLPQDAEVTLYTALPEAFFREELNRPFRVVPCELDCGCVQPDSVTVDISATLSRYAEIESRRESIIPVLADRMRDEKVDLVIGDIPPLAFSLARQAGLPSWAICNFSWADIYAPYVQTHPSFQPMLGRMRTDYALATKHLRLFPHFGDALCPEPEELGVVCREGISRREELAGRIGLNPAKKWCLVYLGNFGLEGMVWERLADFPDWEFFGLYPLSPSVPNYHRVEKDPSLRYADLTASANLVLGKLGYSLVAECLAHGTPILFPGRSDFAEFHMLKHLVEERTLGKEIPLDDLKALRLELFLNPTAALRPEKMEAEGRKRFLELLGFRNG